MASLLGLPVLVGPVLGPILAGWLIDSVSWRAIFFVTAPPALLAVVLVRRLTRVRPDAPTPEANAPRRPLDLVGAALLVPGAVALVYGVGQVTAAGWLRVVVAAGGLVMIAAFVRRSHRVDAPLLQVRLLADPVFAGALAVLALFAGAYFGSMLLIPTYVQITRADSASIAGALSIPAGLAAGLSLQVCTRLVDRLPPRRIVVTGLVLAALAVSLTIVVLRTDTPYPLLGALGALLGAGAGAVLMPSITVATRHLSGPALASGSTIVTLVSQSANAVGNAAVTALLGATIAARTGGLGLEQVSRLEPASRAAVAPELVGAQQLTTFAPLLLILAALLVAVLRLGPRAA
jgi:MFS family permease